MDIKDVVEQAYKNGYEDGKKETAREILTAISEERYFYWDSCDCGKDETYWRNVSVERTLQELAEKYSCYQIVDNSNKREN